MIAFLLCLPVLLILTGICVARPLRNVTPVWSCPEGRQPMPDLDAFLLRSSPRVLAVGRTVKGLYYSGTAVGPHDVAAFHIVCERRLEPRPFLVMDFRSSTFFFDHDRDGCVDLTGSTPRPEIDPAEFYPAIEGAEDLCYSEAVSSLHNADNTSGLVGTGSRDP